MARALRLAARGLWTTTPNPRVGCVIVRDNRVVGEGWHVRAGEPHAEVHALRAAGEAARGATVYVTLEPCSHHGRTPPCADALVAAGVARVVAAMSDPNPQVAGQGLARLSASGIAVRCGVLETEAHELNIGFVSRMTHGRPWVRLKTASTLDGITALDNGVSQWITGPAARRDGHRWRARACAILSGIGTVQEDDPSLTVREVATERQPLRVIVDAKLALSPRARLFADIDRAPVLVACASDDMPNARALCDAGAELLVLPNDGGKVDLPAMLQALGARGINELHAESGQKLNGSLLREGCVDELLMYLAPTVLGRGMGLFNLGPFDSLAQRIDIDIRDVRAVGRDWRVLARLNRQ
ncbi:MAG: bifunctional diaminohydroxyphosphoribosylaminopyrimidine deaminase/5-amino-6-(5-phosphoribosylamino)uracil reductase RibD [Methyloversatilis sp.]|nr:bifunctional diaminohydroxyphosphoribosylaminopyrimidine deaminase/5-amino-6-(5-phosphoribosylamino)uracil reductase RibD [Methyloversatilis sp.]MBP6195115.1 bifunctional diaminohydroxyphosphoribosylaminopyrimidine deaminase/5-amino-6-(5-phosphoribosylamino)uracil reductase RibD [Methyloversatilis sp.]MBP9118856.1 bifunctional diaminohydroxyphosphoribosylaminopyrimidine deaminase/5-amino-6-(5-phosphoribosylamino)uracil reductase RibD [Methyloversatilis sp.]